MKFFRGLFYGLGVTVFLVFVVAVVWTRVVS